MHFYPLSRCAMHFFFQCSIEVFLSCLQHRNMSELSPKNQINLGPLQSRRSIQFIFEYRNGAKLSLAQYNRTIGGAVTSVVFLRLSTN